MGVLVLLARKRWMWFSKDDGDAIVYDNQMGDPDDGDATIAIGGGSIVIHEN